MLRLRSSLRYRLQYPIEYRLDLVKSGFRRLLDPGAETIRFLIISDDGSYTSEQQFAPLRRYAAALRNELGVTFRYMRLSEGVSLDRAALSQFSAVGLKIFFRSEEPGQIVARFRERISGTDTKLVYFDGDDDVCVQWPEILPLVDLYVKKGIFASEEDYLRKFVGKSNLTDYVWKEHGIPPGAGDIPASGVLDHGDLAKLDLGWSIALDDKIAELFEKVKPTPSSAKDIDIVCRMSVPTDWLFSLRNATLQRLEAMTDRYRVLLPTNRVSQDQYYQEMQRARICVSPLGYGEVCWRDFEAIICGCLLVKPDMSHLRTYPEIFVPGETYVPVRWDYADLAETCARYLDREAERAQIIDNAYRVLTDCQRDGAFVRRFAGLLDRVGLMCVHPRCPH
jgi:glycosyltransferase involved in cell wall biosynthesis